MKNNILQSIILTILLLIIPILIGNLNSTIYYQQIVEPGVKLENLKLTPLNHRELINFLQKIKEKQERRAQNAHLAPNSTKVIPEQNGITFNINQTANKLLTAQTGTKISLNTIQIRPKITTKFITNNKKIWINFKNNSFKLKVSLLSTYTTPLNNDQSTRVNNIQVALNNLNGLVINPKDKFSFNKAIGRLNAKNGYQKAPAIINNELKLKYGGGVCQVSSTLYNNLLNANLEILERHPHSLQVNYVPPGKDATVAPGFKDLKFSNNKKFPITILGEIINKKVVIFLLKVHKIS
ncbi:MULTISPECIES: VanW family protein [unclassified Candidatus Frackibacter]|uniref:VanW family protein n=1 Tax=unclassified Candidatus Frackibacter TaxID=2648818 RepID=UPI0008805899|nr:MULTISPECIES: VanW family protein [unclassified Candidatus Frackibacter]SDC38065.1 VanW like protein [Candidatus Frackibacter sp. WG11]SEM62163.1 VanW like protein [Candidatus Frackibacter sp. WG12]SFL65764.1 VanW like protein [Candidatus Frackibacter sp. WG13]